MLPFSQFSKSQRSWLTVAVLLCIGLVLLGLLMEPGDEDIAVPPLTLEMSIMEVAPPLETTGKSLARELDLPLDVPKTKPLSELGVKQGQLDSVAAHLLSHRPTKLKYYLYTAIVLWGWIFLTKLGRPDGSPISQRKHWYPQMVYLLALTLAVLLCGFLLGKSPNPMEGIVKVFKAMAGLYPSVADKLMALLFFLGLTVIGNKILCGWACPFGALQELIYRLPILNKIKRRKVPFLLSNTIRGGLFLVMLLVLFGVVGGKRGLVIYHGMNPFNLFNLQFELLAILITTIVTLVLSLGVYRPFCQFICPFGFVSWVMERLSLTRVRIDRDRCTACGACGRACPTGAASSLVKGQVFSPDCFSCARCLKVCPEDAITYSCSLGKTSRRSDHPSVSTEAETH